MNVDTGLETARARPLSAGLWTLLSWLRREEHSSTESLSSVGSDGTAVSFSFLAPPPPRVRTTAVPLTPLSSPTDSYRKRVREQNVRRQQDRDLTLRSKYGLYRADNGYDAVTLPTRRSLIDNSDKENRDRRAASECLERRAAYVPGKRRAPLPPTLTATHPSSLTHRRTSRKRPAPKPPSVKVDHPKESDKHILNTSPLMSSKSNHANLRPTGTSSEYRSEKYNKKDGQAKDTTKTRTEKSFLRQLFESKKRNSTMETVPERILPSISELDKQAAAIIESCKLKALNENYSHGSSSHVRFCTRCLRRYDSDVVSCTNCLSEQKLNFDGLETERKVHHNLKPSDTCTQTASTPIGVASSSRIGAEEKEKLKEMLKEMKNSLPKRPKHEGNDGIIIKNTNERHVISLETPTLRIGAIASDNTKEIKLSTQLACLDNAVPTQCETSNTRNNENGGKKPKATETVVISQHIVLEPPPQNVSYQSFKPNKVELCKMNKVKANESSITTDILHTPLKISSLLNPIYVPKSGTENQVKRTLFFTNPDAQTKQPQIAEKQTSAVTSNTTTPSTCIASAVQFIEVEDSKKIKTALSDDVKNKEKENQKVKLIPTSLSPPTPTNKSNPAKKESGQLSRPNCKDKKITPSISVTPVSNSSSSNNVRLTVEQHCRRRELINQLEKSIAQGDEAAAADAAMKLAQLRLSCSVLSFSSQIVGETSKLSSIEVQNKEIISSNKNNQNNVETSTTATKVNASVQSMEVVSSNKTSKNKNDVTILNPERKLINQSSKAATRPQETKLNHKLIDEIKIEKEFPKSRHIEEPSTSNPIRKATTNDLKT